MKKLLVVLILIGLGLIAAAYWASPSSRSSGDEGYIYASVERGELTETISATGILQPRDVGAVGSELSGKVIKIYPAGDFNQPVKETEPLIELDPRNAEATLEGARAAQDAAKTGVVAAETERDAAQEAWNAKKELADKGVGLKKEAQQAETQFKATMAKLMAAKSKVREAEAGIERAELGLKLCTVRAPVSGVIIDRKVVLGQLIAPPVSAQLFTIATDLSRLQLHAQVAESDISKVRIGQKARFTVYAYSDTNHQFEGMVEQVREMPTNVQGAVFYDTVIDVVNQPDPDWLRVPLGGIFSFSVSGPLQMLPYLRMRLDGPQWMLRPGMTATVDIIRRTHKDVWKMPMAALNFQLEEAYQTAAAKNRLKEWQTRPDHDSWQVVWIMDKQKKPWPIFVRLVGDNEAGDPGISDGQFKEVLQWDPDLQLQPDPKSPSTFPQVIITAPPLHKSGLFDQVKLKIS